MRHSASRFLFTYWDSLRAGRAAPDRGEIEPGQIRSILADTFILERGVNSGAHFRLAGTRVCALFNRELRAQTIDSLWPERDALEIRRIVDRVAAHSIGALVNIKGTTVKRNSVDLEMLLLPLGYRGVLDTRLIGTVSPSSAPTWLGVDEVDRLALVSHRMLQEASRPDVETVEDLENLSPRRRFVVYQGGRAG